MAVNGSPELLIVMGAGATADQMEHVLARLQEAGVSARVQRGREATVIGAIGEREVLATLPLEGYPGVDQVLPILKPYKLVAREVAPDPTVIEVDGRKIGQDYFGLIAGPCSVEYREQTLEAARAGRQAGLVEARPLLVRRGAADGGRVRGQGGERADHPLRARDQDLRDLDALHAGSGRRRGAEAGDPPAGDRGSLARRGEARAGAPAGTRGGRGRGRRDHLRDASAARGGALRRPAADPERRVRRFRARSRGHRRADGQADRLTPVSSARVPVPDPRTGPKWGTVRPPG